jgi:L-fucose isomerase-like protein
MLEVALVCIARPTFDVPLAQSVADAVLRQLQGAGMVVVGTGAELLMDTVGAEKAMAALQSHGFDLLILLQASFADSSVAVQIAQVASQRGLPTLLWAVPDERSGGRLRLNSLCGINLAAHAFVLHNLKYDYVLAAAESAAALVKIGVLARCGRALRALRGARLGLVGQHPAGFDTCRYDAGDLKQLFGVEVAAFDLPGVLEAARRIPNQQRQAFLQRVGDFTPNLAELDAAPVAGTAGVYCALRDLAAQNRLSGVAVRCWPEFFTELGCAACGAMSLLNEEFCPASCEADVNGTLTLVLLQALSGSQAFVTDLVSIEAESDTGVLWHCGLAPVSMADPEHGVYGTIHSNRKLPLLFEFPLKPGRVTLARLHRTGRSIKESQIQRSEITDSYRFVIGGGEIVRAPKAFSGASGVIKFDRPALEVFDRVMRLGLEHHFCITYGDVGAELHSVASLVGLEVIDLTA